MFKARTGGFRQRASAQSKITRARDGATIEIADVADLMLECAWPLKLGRGDSACMGAPEALPMLVYERRQ
jgi:hypothetical protein